MLTLVSTIAELIGLHPLFAAFLLDVAFEKILKVKDV